jgi:hypothetical protein
VIEAVSVLRNVLHLRPGQRHRNLSTMIVSAR